MVEAWAFEQQFFFFLFKQTANDTSLTASSNSSWLGNLPLFSLEWTNLMLCILCDEAIP